MSDEIIMINIKSFVDFKLKVGDSVVIGDSDGTKVVEKINNLVVYEDGFVEAKTNNMQIAFRKGTST